MAEPYDDAMLARLSAARVENVLLAAVLAMNRLMYSRTMQRDQVISGDNSLKLLAGPRRVSAR